MSKILDKELDGDTSTIFSFNLTSEVSASVVAVSTPVGDNVATVFIVPSFTKLNSKKAFSVSATKSLDMQFILQAGKTLLASFTISNSIPTPDPSIGSTDGTDIKISQIVGSSSIGEV